MSVAVLPEQFRMVLFDNAAIVDVAREVLARLGMSDRNLRIEVDESTPVARVRVELGDPIVVRAESGAFEDVRRPRNLSERSVALNLGRALLRVRDRTDGTFAEAPADEQLSLADLAAWDAYIAGRLERYGQRINRQRFLYNFRNRHGFTDVADAAFDQLWDAEHLTWNELRTISSVALAARA